MPALPWCLALLAAGLLLTAGCAGTPASGHRTLFTVPVTLPDGTSSETQREELERWLVERAGGYTMIGTGRGGWKSPAGEVITEENHVYIVGVYDGDPETFAKEVNDYIVKNFDQQEAWVERW